MSEGARNREDHLTAARIAIARQNDPLTTELYRLYRKLESANDAMLERAVRAEYRLDTIRQAVRRIDGGITNGAGNDGETAGRDFRAGEETWT